MKLYYAPLSTYSQKVLTALYEKGVDFEREIVNLMDDDARRQYRKRYPLGKVPLLVTDEERMIPESSIIIEYLDMQFDTGTRLIPEDRDLARQVRFRDRMFDLYLNDSVSQLVFESWKPEAARDSGLIEKLRFRTGVMYDYMDRELGEQKWAAASGFSMADCAAAPALLYAQEVAPFADRANVNAYWKRLQERPSFREVLGEVRPYLDALEARKA